MPRFSSVASSVSLVKFHSLGYSFNGKEKDSETDLQDYGFRIYNSKLCRFLSVDPLTKDYPWYTPYQFAGNKPIQNIDLDGCEEKNTANMPVNNPSGSYGTDYKWEPNRQYVNEHRSDEHPETNGVIPTGGQIYWSDLYQVYWIALNAPAVAGSATATGDIAGEQFKPISPIPADPLVVIAEAKPVLKVQTLPPAADKKIVHPKPSLAPGSTSKITDVPRVQYCSGAPESHIEQGKDYGLTEHFGSLDIIAADLANPNSAVKTITIQTTPHYYIQQNDGSGGCTSKEARANAIAAGTASSNLASDYLKSKGVKQQIIVKPSDHAIGLLQAEQPSNRPEVCTEVKYD